MIRTYRITFVHNFDRKDTTTERAHTAEDALTQFRTAVAACEPKVRVVRIDSVEDEPPKSTGLQPTKREMPFGGALVWLLAGVRVRRASWPSAHSLTARHGYIQHTNEIGTCEWGGRDALVASQDLLANDWEVIVDARDAT